MQATRRPPGSRTKKKEARTPVCRPSAIGLALRVWRILVHEHYRGDFHSLFQSILIDAAAPSYHRATSTLCVFRSVLPPPRPSFRPPSSIQPLEATYPGTSLPVPNPSLPAPRLEVPWLIIMMSALERGSRILLRDGWHPRSSRKKYKETRLRWSSNLSMAM